MVMKVSVLLLIHNEEANLPRCIEALNWCDDIVAIDSGSTDGSMEILSSFGVRVLHRSFDDFATQRNFGLKNGAFRHEWVLHLDADEVVTPEFSTALDALNPTDHIDGYYVLSKVILFERWLKYAGMWPSYQARLGHRERMRFKQIGHGQREDLPAHRMATFDEPYLHYNFSHGMKRWLEKHIRYAKDEAAHLGDIIAGKPECDEVEAATYGRRRMKRLAANVPLFLRPLARFIYIYLWRRGFLDGRAGLTYAVMLSVYEGMIAVFAYEMLLGGDRQPFNSTVPPRPALGS
jgi:glycosyltransferase involved in cell wall biosynthesis